MDLIRWNPDPFEKLWRAETPPIPVYTYGVYGVAEIGIYVKFGGAIGVFADLDFGLSSRGITQDLNHDGRPDGNVLNGFFFGDNRPAAPDKPDEFELGVTFQLYGAVQGAFKILGYDVAAVTGRVGLQGTSGWTSPTWPTTRPTPKPSTARSAWG